MRPEDDEPPIGVGDTGAFVDTAFKLGLLALVCTLVEPVRGVSLQVVVATLAFDIHRLSGRQTSWIAVLGFAIATLSLWTSPNSLRLIDVVTIGTCLAALVAVGRHMRWIQTRQHEQQDALSAALVQWRTMSRHDALTGALCRRHGAELIQQEVERQGRDHQPFSVGVLDVDHFKRINDTWGHALGDEVLIDLVRLTKESLGAENKVVRWGGEEFVLLLPSTPLAEAEGLLRRLRDRVVGHDWSHRATGLLVDVSIGVAQHRASDTVEVTLGRADAALYRAKAEGRGRVVHERY